MMGVVTMQPDREEMGSRPAITFEEARLATILDRCLERREDEDAPQEKLDGEVEEELEALLEIAGMLRERGRARRSLA
jgi:hypothetical protein